MTGQGHHHLQLGPWRADRMLGQIAGPGPTRTLEPKVMDLLFALAGAPGRVYRRDELLELVWPAVTVGEDALTRSIFKLRAALSGGPDRHCSIETIPKRGYRLLLGKEPARDRAPGQPRRPGFSWSRAIAVCVAALFLLGGDPDLAGSSAGASTRRATIERARDAYFQYTQRDNEGAIILFERVLANDPDDPEALAGLASGIAQRAIRWPGGQEAPGRGSRLQAAIRSGRLAAPPIRRELERALALAVRAARLRPNDSDIKRTHALVLAALGRTAEAGVLLDRTIAADPTAWGAMINRADLKDMEGDPLGAVALLERAYLSMDARYDEEPARIRPWLAQTGMEVARRHAQLGHRALALQWYRRTTRDNPHAAATEEPWRSVAASAR